MAKKTKGEWPYHEDPHGNWIACSSNPCKLHSGGDIMATSPEDAYAKADRMAHPQGGDGLTGADAAKPVDRGAEEVRRIVEKRRGHEADVREKMKTFYKEPVADPPEDLKRTYDARLDIGGKYLETQKLPKGKVATLMRRDIAQLKRAGGIPKGWRVKVRTNHVVNDNDFKISIITPEGTAPAYRHVRPSDIYDPDNEGEGKPDYQEDLKKEIGSKDYTYDQAVEYCKRHQDIRLDSDEFEETRKYLQDVANQYSMYGASSRDWDGTAWHDSLVMPYPEKERKDDKPNVTDMASSPSSEPPHPTV